MTPLQYNGISLSLEEIHSIFVTVTVIFSTYRHCSSNLQKALTNITHKSTPDITLDFEIREQTAPRDFILAVFEA